MAQLGEFERKLQSFIANASIGASTTRRLIPKRSIGDVRRFLKTEIKPEIFANVTAKNFGSKLDRLTKKLQTCSSRGYIRWGPARKFINLYLRDLSYNYRLRRVYRFSQFENFLELPIDSNVAVWLEAKGAEGLPRWPGVKHLGKSKHIKFQECADAIAEKCKISKVHLDLDAWRNEEVLKSARRNRKK